MSVQYVCSVFFLLIYMQFISNLEDEAAFSLHVCHGEDDCVCTYVSARTTATDVCAYWLISLSPLLFCSVEGTSQYRILLKDSHPQLDSSHSATMEWKKHVILNMSTVQQDHHSHSLTYTRTHTHTRTYAHMDTHTYAHTLICICLLYISHITLSLCCDEFVYTYLLQACTLIKCK